MSELFGVEVAPDAEDVLPTGVSVEWRLRFTSRGEEADDCSSARFLVAVLSDCDRAEDCVFRGCFPAAEFDVTVFLLGR